MGRRVIAIIIALAVALFGTIGVVGYAQGADSRAVAGQQIQNVYVATAQVPRGTSAANAVAQKLIVRQRIVARGVPAGALTDVGTHTGPLLATSDIMQGEIVLASRFGVPDVTKAQVIPAGKIAITVSLTDPERIAPLLTPHSHIVIFDTSGGGVSGKSGSATLPRLTRILLPDVEVIGVGDLIVQTAQTPTPTPTPAQGSQPAATTASLVTVAVSPADGQLLVHEIQAGNLLYGALLGGAVKVNPKYVVSDSSIRGH